MIFPWNVASLEFWSKVTAVPLSPFVLSIRLAFENTLKSPPLLSNAPTLVILKPVPFSLILNRLTPVMSLLCASSEPPSCGVVSSTTFCNMGIQALPLYTVISVFALSIQISPVLISSPGDAGCELLPNIFAPLFPIVKSDFVVPRKLPKIAIVSPSQVLRLVCAFAQAHVTIYLYMLYRVFTAS